MSTDRVQVVVVERGCRRINENCDVQLCSCKTNHGCTRYSSGFPIVIWSHCDADTAEASGGGGGGGGVEGEKMGGRGGRMEWKTKRKEQKIRGEGKRDKSNISNEDHNQTYCLTE